MGLVTSKFKEVVNCNDVVGIKSALYTIILSDPFFSSGKFDDALEYVVDKKGKEFFDEHDGEVFLAESEWNEEYYNDVLSRLSDNFSEERVEKVKEIAKKINCYKKSDYKSIDISKTKNEKENGSNKRDIDEYSWAIAIILLIGVVWLFRKIFKGGK